MFPDVLRELPVFQFEMLSDLSQVTTEKGLAPSSLHPPLRYLHLMRLSLSVLFSRLDSPVSLTHLAGEILQSLQHLSGLSLDSYLGLESPRLVTVSPVLLLSLLEHLGPKLRVMQTASPLGLPNPPLGSSQRGALGAESLL